MAPRTITEALYADHVAVLRDLGRALASPGLIPQIFPTISSSLRRHDKAEAATLYNALATYPVEVAQIHQSEAEHAQIGRLLDRMETIPYSDPRFFADLREVKRLLDAHLAVEQSQVFAAAQTLLPLPRQYQLAERYEIKMGRGRISNASLVRPGLGKPRRNASLVITPPTITIKRRRPWWQHFFGTLPVFNRSR